MRRGFTLVELMVVMGIIGILMLVSVPLFQRFWRGQQLSDGGRVMQQAFREARWQALTRRERTRLLFTKTAIGIYRNGEGYGEEFKKIMLPKGVTYTYNFGGRPYLSPPDDFPPVEEIRDESTGNDFPGKVEFRRDGTVNFGGGFEDVPGPKIDDIRLFDPNREIRKRIPRDVLTDIVIDRKGDTKRCYVDILPNTGRVLFVVREAELGSGLGE